MLTKGAPKFLALSVALFAAALFVTGCPRQPNDKPRPKPQPDWIFQSGDYAVYALTSLDGAGKADDEAGWAEYQWEIETVTQDAVVFRETHIDYFDADDAFETMSYLSDWSRGDRQLMAYRFDGYEPRGLVYDAYSLHWVPTGLRVGEKVMVGGLEFTVARITAVTPGDDKTVLDAWELVHQAEGFRASFLYDTECGLWLGAELAITVDDTEFTETFTLIDTNVPLQGQKFAGAGPVETETVDTRGGPGSESHRSTGAKDASGNQLVITPAFKQSHTRPGSYLGRGEMLTSEVTADKASGAIEFELLGVAEGSLQSISTRTQPRGTFQEDIYISCPGPYEFEIRGYADFTYAIAASDITGIIPRMNIPLPVNRARFNASAGYVIQGGGIRHEDAEVIIDNELITNLDAFDLHVPLPGYYGPEGPSARKSVKDDLIFGRSVSRPVVFTVAMYLDRGFYGVVPYAQAGLSIGVGFMSRTVAEIQGSFQVQSITVTWPHGLPPVQHVQGSAGPSPPATSCPELKLTTIASQIIEGAVFQSGRYHATVPLTPTDDKGDVVFYEGEADFLVDQISYNIPCDTIITPRVGTMVTRVMVTQDEVRLWIGTPEIPGADIMVNCEGYQFQTELGAFGAFNHNYLGELTGSGISGFELKPQPWEPGDDWIANHEEVRLQSHGDAHAFHTDTTIRLEW